MPLPLCSTAQILFGRVTAPANPLVFGDLDTESSIMTELPELSRYPSHPIQNTSLLLCSLLRHRIRPSLFPPTHLISLLSLPIVLPSSSFTTPKPTPLSPSTHCSAPQEFLAVVSHMFQTSLCSPLPPLRDGSRRGACLSPQSFSLRDLSQAEKQLGFFSANPPTYNEESCHLCRTVT